jgi:hypothetical protein
MAGMDDAVTFVADRVSFLYTDDDGTSAYLEQSGSAGYRILLDEARDDGPPAIKDSYYLRVSGPDGLDGGTYGGVRAASLSGGVLALTLTEQGVRELGLPGPQLRITLATEPSTVDEFRQVAQLLLTSGPAEFWPASVELNG